MRCLEELVSFMSRLRLESLTFDVPLVSTRGEELGTRRRDGVNSTHRTDKC
jgi:hypothetical protein